jgi:hypothetical protein
MPLICFDWWQVEISVEVPTIWTEVFSVVYLKPSKQPQMWSRSVPSRSLPQQLLSLQASTSVPIHGRPMGSRTERNPTLSHCHLWLHEWQPSECTVASSEDVSLSRGRKSSASGRNWNLAWRHRSKWKCPSELRGDSHCLLCSIKSRAGAWRGGIT